MDEQGLDVDALAEHLKTNPAPVLMYIVPTAHNPTGRTLPKERREKLVALSVKYNFKLICDEVYHMLTFPHITPPPPMFSFDSAGTVISLGSFSKILAPALRVGWYQASPEILATIKASGQLDSSGGLNPVSFGIVQKAIDLGLQDSHLDETRATLYKRYKSLEDALDKYLPKSCSYEKPQGGYFVIVALPKGKKAVDLLDFAVAKKVRFLPGTSFGDNMQNYLRLSFSYYSAEDIAVGCQRLAEAIEEFLASPKKQKM